MFEYFAKVASVWFVGFSPLTGILSAIPAGVALGLDNVTILFWSVFGSFTPALLITMLYKQMMSIRRVNSWLEGLVSVRLQERADKWGVWFVLLATPWTSMWVMAITVKTLGMNRNRFLISSFMSITFHAVLLLLLIRLGIAAFA